MHGKDELSSGSLKWETLFMYAAMHGCTPFGSWKYALVKEFLCTLYNKHKKMFLAKSLEWNQRYKRKKWNFYRLLTLSSLLVCSLLVKLLLDYSNREREFVWNFLGTSMWSFCFIKIYTLCSSAGQNVWGSHVFSSWLLVINALCPLFFSLTNWLKPKRKKNHIMTRLVVACTVIHYIIIEKRQHAAVGKVSGC